jgi:CheY-like chemotaxis protein
MALERKLILHARHESVPSQTHRRPLRVLVIDDYADEAQSLAQLVGLWGHETYFALNGIDGLVAANDFRPDAVLCDLVMPGIIDGCKVAESLRRHAALSGALLVAVTARSDNEHRRRAARAGFHAYLVKPVDPDHLQRLLDAH